MSKRKNARTLSEIADAVHLLERTNIIDIGDLLLEAKDQECEHGEWLDWLVDAEFDFSVGTAERYMNVAKLNAKFCTLRNLKLGATTLYELANHDDEDDLPAIIKELAKHATKTSLKPRDAERVIKIGIGRGRFGDHPDATLVALADLDEHRSGHEKAVAALQEREPKIDEEAKSIVDEIRWAAMDAKDQEYQEWLRRQQTVQKEDKEIKDEAESLLDGAPPDLPPPTTPPEPQKLHADTDWAETKSFVDAVKELLELRAKPVARFVGMFSPAELREVGDFLVAVAAADKKEAA
jgi:Protein of unknown function (DUF3102)